MGRSGPSVIARQQLVLWTGIVAVALSLLALHQLSLNHTVADPSASPVSVNAAVNRHADVDPDGLGAGMAADPTHRGAVVDQTPGSGPDGCPGCVDHHTAALTCLAVLIVVAIGWALAGPVEWRGLRLRVLLPRLLPEPPQRRPLPLSLVELSIRRT